METRVVVLSSLLWGCAAQLEPVAQGDFCTPVRAQAPDAGFFVFGHSHNDYQHARPLLDALDRRFYSVEADLWLWGDTIVVSHTAFSSKGTLEALYLDPLQRRIDQLGSVHGDGQRFTLWLELKEGGPQLRDALESLLSRYPMFTVFGEGARGGPVVAVLTGDAESKRAYVDERPTRHACRDADAFAHDAPPVDDRWCAYALSWPTVLAWDGVGPMPGAQRDRLACLVGDVHRQGRQVRIYGSPETSEYWKEAIGVGLDFINTDQLDALHDFLAAVQAQP